MGMKWAGFYKKNTIFILNTVLHIEYCIQEALYTYCYCIQVGSSVTQT